ncbi:MAG: nucleoside deaminase [Acidobacteriaceae bacterium]|nr:nucleoside deaminase [Acidobacteriaceae bacterium]
MSAKNNVISPEDERFMRLAIEQACQGDQTPGAGEVGCVIVRGGEVLAAGHNEAEMRHDPTAHAEIVTLRKLGEKLQTTDFRGCTLYCTLQPCGMCSVACIWAKITRIVYGATRNDVHSMYFDTRHFNTADLIRDAFREDMEIVGGVLAGECAQFYYQPDDNPPREEQVNI